MANGKNYDKIEGIGALLGASGLGALQKKISETEGRLSDILKRLSQAEAETSARRDAEANAEVSEAPQVVAAPQEVKAAAPAEEVREASPVAEEKPAAPVVPEAPVTPAPEEAASEPVRPARPSYIKDRPSDHPAEEKPRPAFVKERPSYIKDRPSDRPGYVRSTERPSYIKDRPSDRPGYVKDRPSDRPARPAGDRPARSASPRPSLGATPAIRPALPVRPVTKAVGDKKKTFERTYVEKKPMSKRSLIRQQGMTVEDFDEDRTGYRKLRPAKKVKSQETQTVKIDHVVITTAEIQIKALSEKLGISAVEITKHLFKEGVMKTVNESIDAENAALIAADFGIELEYIPEKTAEDALKEAHEEVDEEKLIVRAPIVTVMGHVDHGKTSLLDRIRSTHVTDGEAGGITQSIGAYSIVVNGHPITFIDTPGHEAFTAMRARGASVTDIVVLVVAGDDGIMPQTVEAINHAKAANVPIIVAVNKMDKPQSDVDRVKNALVEYGLVPEEWGGDVPLVPVSAKTGMGMEDLLETIYLLA
ncbi:MAG: translation initiation factor IF-2 N-terminal domain-containing protein, partial [Christensenellaceae bacterium]